MNNPEDIIECPYCDCEVYGHIECKQHIHDEHEQVCVCKDCLNKEIVLALTGKRS